MRSDLLFASPAAFAPARPLLDPYTKGGGIIRQKARHCCTTNIGKLARAVGRRSCRERQKIPRSGVHSLPNRPFVAIQQPFSHP